MAPKVSIVVPVYNVEEYLPQCLDSLITQTFEDIEIICFNDASTDDSLKILNKYATQDNRVKIIDSPINIRQGGGRNRGIQASKGEYIMFVDSDDWVTPDFVNVMYKTAVETNSDIVTADYYESKKGTLKPISHLGDCLNANTYEIKNKILKNGCRMVTSIFKRSLFFDNNLFYPENITYEDNAIGGALFLSAKRITKIDDFIYYYRVDNYSTTRSKNNLSFFDRLETSKKFLQNSTRIDKNREFCDLINEAFVKLYYVNTILCSIGQFNPYPLNIVKKAKKELYELVEKRHIRKVLAELSLKQKVIVYTSLYATYALPALSLALPIFSKVSVQK